MERECDKRGAEFYQLSVCGDGCVNARTSEWGGGRVIGVIGNRNDN